MEGSTPLPSQGTTWPSGGHGGFSGDKREREIWRVQFSQVAFCLIEDHGPEQSEQVNALHRSQRLAPRTPDTPSLHPKARGARVEPTPGAPSHKVHSHSYPLFTSATGVLPGLACLDARPSVSKASLPTPHPHASTQAVARIFPSYGPSLFLQPPKHHEAGSVIDQEPMQAQGGVRQGQGREEKGQKGGADQAAKGGTGARRGGPTQAGKARGLARARNDMNMCAGGREPRGVYVCVCVCGVMCCDFVHVSDDACVCLCMLVCLSSTRL